MGWFSKKPPSDEERIAALSKKGNPDWPHLVEYTIAGPDEKLEFASVQLVKIGLRPTFVTSGRTQLVAHIPLANVLGLAEKLASYCPQAGLTYEGWSTLPTKGPGLVDGNQREGYGWIALTGPEVLRGNLRNGQLHGFGIYFWKSGGYYAGEWQDGQLHGRGRYIRADGTVEEKGQPATPPVEEEGWKILPPVKSGLTAVLAAETKRAAEKGLRACVYLHAVWAPPCVLLKKSRKHPLVAPAFAGYQVLEVDYDNLPDAERNAVGLGHVVPAVGRLDENGRVVALLNGSAWKDDTPENMGPPLVKFLQG